jgi:methyl-accepting chemotaxis protein
VRGATTDAVAAMTEIGGIIGKINEVSSAIAAAVEQQSATTHEIAASVQAVSGRHGRRQRRQCQPRRAGRRVGHRQ